MKIEMWNYIQKLKDNPTGTSQNVHIYQSDLRIVLCLMYSYVPLPELKYCSCLVSKMDLSLEPKG